MKKLGFDELKGKRILSVNPWDVGDKFWTIQTDGGPYNLLIEDDGCGGNDSNAFLSHVSGMEAILGQPITEVSEESDGYGAVIELGIANGQKCVITIIHEQNGYYGFSYELQPAS
jgi:hypothetical protein